MFLKLLQRRNPRLLQTAAALHRAGTIPANTYLIDLDAVGRNAAAFAAEASRLGLTPFAMTKQIGRNPDVSRTLVANGITHAVGVDLECAVASNAGGLAVGHLGHLVQIPRHQVAMAAALRPLYWTVFNEEKAREVGEAAQALRRVQEVLLRVIAPEDRFYAGHEGGFPVDETVTAADHIDAIPGVHVAGVTTFPATLFDAASGTARATPNRATLGRAKKLLEASGRTRVEVNAPGTTSVSVLEALAEAGATQVEPGHGLTGTTPLHAVEDLEEEPAIAYVSEVSHFHNGSAYVFGGGLYVDPVLGASSTSALVYPGGSIDMSEALQLDVDMPAPEAIDYYCRIPLTEGSASPRDHVDVGDTVIFGFRPQVFVTRSLTAAVSGISTGRPHVEGIWAANGSRPMIPFASSDA